MFFMKKRKSGFISGVAIGMVTAFALGGTLIMSNKTGRREVSKELAKLRCACRDLCNYMN